MKRILSWDGDGWSDYLYWQLNDEAMLKRINKLKTEYLKENLTGLTSKRINDEHRLVHKVYDDRDLIIKCRFHY